MDSSRLLQEVVCGHQYLVALLVCLSDLFKMLFFALKFSSLCPLRVFEFCLSLGSYFIIVLPITALRIQIFGSLQKGIYIPCLLHQPDFVISHYSCFPKASLS